MSAIWHQSITSSMRPRSLRSMRDRLLHGVPPMLRVPLPGRLAALGHARRHWWRAVLLAVALAGAALLAAGLWMPAKAELAQHLLNRAWVAARASGGADRVQPWPWADTWPVARLHFASRAEPLTVLAGASGRNLAFGPALLDGSADIGAPGLSVIAGHRDTQFGALADLALGERFELELPDGSSLAYEVANIDVVDSSTAALRLDGEESAIALVTCWPFDALAPGGALRFVVTGRPPTHW
ncbi:MAG TPA: class GN sortase [Gammaproteobacteria bacterium]|nr:class GN sortase [Gammaproteobacteria bacterium]